MASPSTPATTNSKRPYEKSAEFARLYHFFEKLTQPRSQARASGPEAAARDASVPEDIAPLLKNLSAILKKDSYEDQEAFDNTPEVNIPDTPSTAIEPSFNIPPPSSPSTPCATSASTRPRRNTVGGEYAGKQPPTGQGMQGRGSPMKEKRYPFTFKFLLHKLYNLDDWAAKVQDVLTASQEQFRPLDSPPARSPGSPGSPGASVPGSLFATPPSPESPERRQRSQSISTKAKGGDGPRFGPGTALGQPSRAVKRRIVNRRRSMNGPDLGQKGEWIYDAAVSSVDAELAEAKKQEDSLRRRKRVLSSAESVEDGRRLVGRDTANVAAEARVHFKKPVKTLLKA
ncbi:hypothetical protein BC834DRAFT_858181 [Gloeopeniophorella convolvens]|nr:hypothetical protein BC834DRAFT_858181 [Gloeopeniophorella convolvens]